VRSSTVRGLHAQRLDGATSDRVTSSGLTFRVAFEGPEGQAEAPSGKVLTTVDYSSVANRFNVSARLSDDTVARA